MLVLMILLLTIGIIGYIISLGALGMESKKPVTTLFVINFTCVTAMIIGILIACNKVQEVECTKCGSKRLESASVKYCDICGSELIPVNEK